MEDQFPSPVKGWESGCERFEHARLSGDVFTGFELEDRALAWIR